MITKVASPQWMRHRLWSRPQAIELGRELGAPVPVAQVLINRGAADREAALRFLNPAWEHLHDPSLLLGVDRAVERLRVAIDRREPVLVHGDYDVDGVTSTFLMVAVLRGLGGRAEPCIPHRTRDGYGLSVAAIERAAADGFGAVVTVDCGIGAMEPIARARELGLDVLVVDHHEPGPALPAAFAIVNPHQPGCPYPDKSLAGVGVSFKVAQALLRSYGKMEWAGNLLDVVALGTIADAVPLSGENRVLASLGLERLSNTRRPGLQALIELCGLAGRRISAGQVAFQIAPRMNAAGRMGSADQALALLFARDREQGRACAESLDEDNQRRRQLDELAERQASERVETELGWPDCWSIVLWSEEWHPGVLGIVASRLVERYQRPAVLLSLKEGRARGSGRSVAGFNLTRLLSGCDDLLEAYGGHAYAAGLTVTRERLPELKERIERLVRESLDLEACAPRLTLDDELPLGACDTELLSWLERLPPHGLHNPEPVFTTSEVAVEDVRCVADGRHLKFRARDASGDAEAIGFGLGERAEELARAGRCELAFVPQANEWMGETRVQLKVKGLRLE